MNIDIEETKENLAKLRELIFRSPSMFAGDYICNTAIQALEQQQMDIDFREAQKLKLIDDKVELRKTIKSHQAQIKARDKEIGRAHV